MNNQIKEKGYPNFLSFLFSTFFIVLTATGSYILYHLHGPEIFTKPFLILLSIAAVSSLIQLKANEIGWSAELKKIEAIKRGD